MADVSAALTAAERDRLYLLCARLTEEKDFLKFLELTNELNDLFECRQHRLDERVPETVP